MLFLHWRKSDRCASAAASITARTRARYDIDAGNVSPRQDSPAHRQSRAEGGRLLPGSGAGIGAFEQTGRIWRDQDQPGPFPTEAQARILEEHWPLGRILKDHQINFTSCPVGYLRIASDPLINEVLGLSGAHLLFGRRNRLSNSSGKSLAEIVEILPPA